MALSDTQARAIIRRIREVLDEGYGSLREMAADRVALGNDGVDETDAPTEALVSPRIHIKPGPWAPSASRPASVNSHIDIETITWIVVAEYSIPASELGEDFETREDLFARAVFADPSLFKAALEEPANLQADSLGNATGIIAGTVTAIGAAPRYGADLLTVEHRYSAEVHVTEETS